MDEVRKNDDALFEALNKAKRRKRRRRWITVLVILAIVASGILYAVNVLRKRVEASMATEGDEVLTYDASIGSISTRVSGSGTIEDVDTEKVTVPEGVEIDEVMVKSNDKLRKGDLIATLDLTSVLSTMASVQEELNELDKELASSSGDRVNTNVTAGVSGRVKKIYAKAKTDVAACMVENGALALISLCPTLSLHKQIPYSYFPFCFWVKTSAISGDHSPAAAAAAKSFQSCPTLCDPIDGSPPGSPVPGILQARTLEWVAISFSNA